MQKHFSHGNKFEINLRKQGKFSDCKTMWFVCHKYVNTTLCCSALQIEISVELCAQSSTVWLMNFSSVKQSVSGEVINVNKKKVTSHEVSLACPYKPTQYTHLLTNRKYRGYRVTLHIGVSWQLCEIQRENWFEKSVCLNIQLIHQHCTELVFSLR